MNLNKEGKLELSYLWLGDNCLPNIKNQGFNFSTDLEFEFIENKLSIKYKNKFINNFYGKNIINISAIVGENGSGKTSVINFLKDCCYETGKVGNDEKDNATIKKGIVIFKKSDKLHIFYNIDFEKHKVNNASNYQMIFHNLIEKNFVDEFNELGRRVTIFYSDIFNCRRGNLSENEIGIRKRYNISTDYLIVLDKDNELSNGMNIDQVENFNVSDIFRKLNFILDKSEILEKNEIIMPAIKYIKICINDENDWLESGLNNLDSENPFVPVIKKVGKLLQVLISNRDNINEKTNHYFKLSIIFNILLKLSDYLQEKDSDKLLYREERKEELRNCIKESLQQYDKDSETENKISSINLDNYFKITKNLLIYLRTNEIFEENLGVYDFIDVLDIFKGKWVERNNPRKLILEVSVDNGKLLRDFFKEYLKSNILSLFKIKWVQEVKKESRTLSSGEEAMLKIYSRFYSMINDIDININNHHLKNRLKDDEKNLLILLDEPELYLHPEWQRKLLSRLVEFFEVIFKDKNIQIILTSNTPFVISDIPKDNIIFMKKNKQNDLCEVISKDNIEAETFGANIHVLLTNSFFMENTIGEFANQKIKAVAKDLSRDIDGISEDRKKEIKYIIDTIGEPIIKRKLKDMYNKKFEYFKINNRIEELSSKVKELEKIIKENDLS